MNYKNTYVLLLIFLSSYSFAGEGSKQRLYDFSFQRYSQHGEDGIIKKIFEVMGVTSKVCVEFGAWDGFFASNTAYLWSEENWKAILIECDADKCVQLKENTKNYNCLAVQAKVGIEPENTLEFILEKVGFKDPIDLLSIDIDGDDIYIFDSLKTLRPRVVICEFNPTMPQHLDIYPKYNNFIGCSVAALCRVAKSKGYELVAVDGVNAFFVVKEEFYKFKDFETSLDRLIKDVDIIKRSQKYVITSYDGRYLIVKPKGGKEYYSISTRLDPEELNGDFDPL